MSNEILWVAMRDGTGWASSRTRDMVDLAFTVSKEDSDGKVLVTIRKPNRDDDPTSRATRVVGMVYYGSVMEAKDAVKAAVDGAHGSDKDSARTNLLEHMLTTSEPHTNAVIVVGNKAKNQSHYSVVSIPEPAVVESVVEEMIEEQIERPVGNSDAMKTWMEIVEDIANSFDMEKAVEVLSDAVDVPTNMVETVEAVQETTQYVFNPEAWQPGEDYPSDYMLIGGRLIKMEWPK